MNPEMSEGWAATMLTLAIRNGQAAELIQTLWNGGTFTVDLENKRLAFLTAEMMEQALGHSGD